MCNGHQQETNFTVFDPHSHLLELINYFSRKDDPLKDALKQFTVDEIRQAYHNYPIDFLIEGIKHFIAFNEPTWSEAFTQLLRNRKEVSPSPSSPVNPNLTI